MVMFQIVFTPEAVEDLRSLRKQDQQRVLDAVGGQLSHQPADTIRNRKRLRPNRLAEWELRAGDFRVFYDLKEEESLVRIVAVGHKRGSRLFVHGEEYEL